ncbi:MAG: O-antigen ligase family protein [Synergistaceae bacterium]|nr:O-antigen ligase family protein [Synergistota bacterium]NLM71406.1 O-antigen ligase family protein [Synergistaceae bacterium]
MDANMVERGLSMARAKGKGGKGGRRATDPLRAMPMAPRWLTVAVLCTSLTLPNIVFSGRFFYSPLHLAKWAVALFPLALLGAVAGWRLLLKGPKRSPFKPDSFAVVWLLLLLHCALQPLWTDVRSPVGLVREWLFFGGVWLTYVLALNLADRRLLDAVLWGGVLCAAASVLLAEMQMHGATGICPRLFYSSAKAYLANTGQRNMLALWLAIGGASSAHLALSGDRGRFARWTAAGLFTVISFGLIRTNSLSGLLGLSAALVVMLLFRLRASGRSLLRSAMPFILVGAAAAAFIALSPSGGKAGALRWKFSYYASRIRSIGSLKPWTVLGERDTIWATTFTMIGERPIRGFGLGQYKWNYLHAQWEALRRWPHLPWGYTQWAHNEFLQWLAEAGAAGAAIMLFLWLWWLWALVRALIRRSPLSQEAVWGCSLVALFGVNAMWTRPFHRIENAVWLALAFAVANRELLGALFPVRWRERARTLARPFGAVVCLGSVAGLLYLADGVRGDRILRLARQEVNPMERYDLLDAAWRSPMVRDLAETELAYFFIQFGEVQKDPDLIAEGVNRMIDVFESRPHIKELGVLRDWAVKLKHGDLARYVSFFSDIPADLAEAGE